MIAAPALRRGIARPLDHPGLAGDARGWPGPGLTVLFGVALAAMPLLRPSGPGNTSPVDLLVLVALVALVASLRGRHLRLRAPYFYPWAVLIAAGCISTVAGAVVIQNEQDIGFPVSSSVALVQDVYILVWTAAVANVCRDARTLGVLLATWAVSAAAWAALMTAGVVLHIHALSGIEAVNGVRAEGTFGDPNMASNYYAMSLMVLWAARRPRSRPLRAALAVLLLVGMVLTGSNGAVLNLGISAGVCLLILAVRRWGLAMTLAATIAAGLVVAGALVLVPPDAVQQAAQDSGQPILRDWIGRSNGSLSQRVVILGEAATLAAEGGPLGLGPGSTKPLLAETQANYVHAAHDDYVAAFVERGLLGAVGLLLMIGAIAVRAAGAIRRPLRPEFAAVVNPVPLVGALCGLAAAATYYQVLHFRHVWALLGIVAALYVWGVRRLEPV